MNRIYFIIAIVSIYILYSKCKNGGLIKGGGSINGICGIVNGFGGKGFSGADICDDKFYDKSQFLFTSLQDYFDTLSQHGRRSLSGKCEKKEFTRYTIDDILKVDLNQIIKLVLEGVNKNLLFKFTLLNYENVIVLTDKKGNKRYIIEFQVTDPKTHYGISLKLDAIKYVNCSKNGNGNRNGNDKKGVSSKTTPAFKRYYVGYPSLEQMIPMPTDVITTGKIVLGNEGVETIVPVPMKYLYINSVVIENSTWTLDINNKCDIGVDGNESGETSLPFSNNVGTGNFTPYIDESGVRNSWPKLDDEPIDTSMKKWDSNSKIEIPTWDENGVYSNNNNKKGCHGINTATNPYPNRPNFWANNYALPKNAGENFWLFDLARGLGIGVTRD